MREESGALTQKSTFITTYQRLMRLMFFTEKVQMYTIRKFGLFSTVSYRDKPSHRLHLPENVTI